MKCEKCGSQLPEDALFCPECGQRVAHLKKQSTAMRKPLDFGNLKDRVDTWLTALKRHQVPTKFKKHQKTIIGLVVVILIAGVGYYGMYLPHKVDAALNQNMFTKTQGFTIKKNTFTKKVTIQADSIKAQRMISAVAANNFDTQTTGAESQLGSAAGMLGGKWRLMITQTQSKDAPHVLWQYTAGKETVRFQKSDVCLKAREAYLQQQTKDAENQGNVDTVTAGIGGALLGSFLTR